MYDGGAGGQFNAADSLTSGVHAPHRFNYQNLQSPPKHDAEVFHKSLSEPSLHEPSAKATSRTPSPARISRDLAFESDYLGRLNSGLDYMPRRSLFDSHLPHHTPPPKNRTDTAARPWTAPASYASVSERLAGRGDNEHGSSAMSHTQDQQVYSKPTNQNTVGATDMSVSGAHDTESIPRYLREDHTSEKLTPQSPPGTKSEAVDDEGAHDSNRSFVEELNDSGGLPSRPAMAKVTPDKTWGF